MIHHPATQTTHHSTRQPTLQTLRKRKNLVFNDASSRCQFNSLAFTHDNENIVALAGTPEWSLVVWRWAKGKQLILKRLSDMNSPLSLFSLNPLDSETNVVMGPQVGGMLPRSGLDPSPSP